MSAPPFLGACGGGVADVTPCFPRFCCVSEVPHPNTRLRFEVLRERGRAARVGRQWVGTAKPRLLFAPLVYSLLYSLFFIPSKFLVQKRMARLFSISCS